MYGINAGAINFKAGETMDLAKALELLNGAMPAIDRLNEDGKRIQAYLDDWKEAVRALDGDPVAQATILAQPFALLMKAPKRFSFNFDPFKPVRLLADDFARACDFKRYKERRKL